MLAYWAQLVCIEDLTELLQGTCLLAVLSAVVKVLTCLLMKPLDQGKCGEEM